MAKVAAAVVEEVNEAGGVLGRKVAARERGRPDQSRAGVRAARKLIDVDKVSAIMGTWASSVTTAVAPLCWESKTFLCTVSGADSITLLPHQGYPHPHPAQHHAAGDAGRRVPPVAGGQEGLHAGAADAVRPVEHRHPERRCCPRAAARTGSLIYDDKKTTYRTEVDQALRFGPDVDLLAHGYTPDTIVLLKDLYRAGFKGKILGFAYSINQKLIDQIGQPEVVEGVYTYRAVAGRGQRRRSSGSRAGRARPIPIPTPARSTTTSTWC